MRISQVHDARARLRADEAAELLGTLDALRIGITIFDPDERLCYANAHMRFVFPFLPRMGGMIGKTYEEMIRLEIDSGGIAPSALTRGTEAFIACRLTQLREGAFTPHDLPLADKRVLEIKARRAPDGHTVLLWTDVTAARAHFARLEEMIALTADAFAFYDADDRFIMGNALYAELVGAGLDSIRGAKFCDVIGRVLDNGSIVIDIPREEWLARRLRGHREPASALTLKTMSGKAYLLRDRATPDGGRALVFTDITDKTRTEAALAEQMDALARIQSALDASRSEARQQDSYLADLTLRLDQASAKADSAKTTLLRTMSHELKTPLNAILGFSDLMATLAGNLSPDQIREYAGLIHQGGTNLFRMINQIMDLTKISAGRYDLFRVPIDAGAVLWQVRDSFSARAEAKSHTIDTEDCALGLTIDADEAVFGIMLNNLVDNALTFTPRGGIIRLTAARAEDGRVAVAVQDNGPGVAADDLARIQEPFEHGGATTEHAKGAGLGLTLVKAFAKLHGGELVLASAPERGFCATLLMPECRARG